jgi:hypothetical protein
MLRATRCFFPGASSAPVHHVPRCVLVDVRSHDRGSGHIQAASVQRGPGVRTAPPPRGRPGSRTRALHARAAAAAAGAPPSWPGTIERLSRLPRSSPPPPLGCLTSPCPVSGEGACAAVPQRASRSPLPQPIVYCPVSRVPCPMSHVCLAC